MRLIYSSAGEGISREDLLECLASKSDDGFIYLVEGDHVISEPTDSILFVESLANRDLYLYDSGMLQAKDGLDEKYDRTFTVCDSKLQPITFKSNLVESITADHIMQRVNEARTKDAKALEIDLASIEADLEDFGPEGFYNIPFHKFCAEYPEFYKSCVKTYLKEMDILTDEDTDEDVNEMWQNGELFMDEDWECLLKGAHMLVNGTGVQWEKLAKSFFGAEEYLH